MTIRPGYACWLSFQRDGRMCCGIVDHDLVVRVLDKGMPPIFRERTCDRCISLASLGGFVYVEPEAITTEDELRHWITRGVAFTEQNVSTRRRRSR
jgi:hypothetical protein